VPASLLWDFRLASLAQLTVMWLTLGLVFGLLMERAAAPRLAAEDVAQAGPSASVSA
jgi:predicted cobalt transporter CbtA